MCPHASSLVTRSRSKRVCNSEKAFHSGCAVMKGCDPAATVWAPPLLPRTKVAAPHSATRGGIFFAPPFPHLPVRPHFKVRLTDRHLWIFRIVEAAGGAGLGAMDQVMD